MNAVGRYEIVRRIGVGGMGEVFFAWAYGVARTRKPVVVKVLRAEMLAEPGAPEMFVEEGRLSLRLSHSNILQVFDFGKADDRYFMAMEFVDGYHLGELRKKNAGRLAPEQAAFIAMEVCLALDYAHRLKDDQGAPLHIVHRDVTPSNILISREGEVKLADFGIARSVGRSQHTQAGQIRGKVRYMAPEAARGEALDHRADLFSLGAILFELLTGQRAFEGKGREAILQQVVGSRVPPPSTVDPSLPIALDEVVTRATAPKRDERFPDAFAMHRSLESACRKAGLAPSRGSFLEFLRELDASAPAEDPSARHESGARAAVPRSNRTQSGPIGRHTPSVPEPSSRSPSPSSAPSSSARGVAPQQSPEPGATAAVAPPSISATPGARLGSVPWAPSSRGTPSASKPSSTTGSVPPPVKGPDTALPTGVASPIVLFTLTVAGELTPSSPEGADVSDLPVFEVTRGEGIVGEFRDVERITPGGVQDAVPRPRDDEFSSTPEPLFPERQSGASERQSGASERQSGASERQSGASERQSGASEETIVRDPTPLEPANEPTVPPAGAQNARVFDDVPVTGDTVAPPVRTENTPVPALPESEATVAPHRSSDSAAETEIRMRPSLDDEPGPASHAGSGSVSGSGSRSVSVSVSARSVRGRSTSGQAARAAPAPERPPADAPDDLQRGTGDTVDSRPTGDTLDTVNHLDEAPRRPAVSVVRSGEPVDSAGRWRRRGELPPEPAGIDYPDVRRPGGARTPLLAGVAAIVIVLGVWLGSQVVGSVGETPTPTPRMTPFAAQTSSRAVETPAPPTPAPTPEATAVVVHTPPPPRTPVVVATPPRSTSTPRHVRTATPAPTQVASVQYGFLVINSQPWSQVRLGGRLLGNTPLKNVRLVSGRHVLTFRNPVSGLERSVEVEVVANETKPVLVELK